MIIGSYFDGDNDDKLMMHQHGCYYDMLREWITMAGVRRLRYRTSPKWAEVTQMWERFREEGYYDHRSIQMPHDLIAARFRMVAQQMTLPDDEKEGAWYTFFKAEAAVWLEHDDFLRCFMIALSDKGSSAAYDAEETMLVMMRKQYIELL
jgi:hypothetical protein